ncbi:hypothetical protein N7493_001643 [Penicillium malachiteum]|uniref:Glycine zipper 2TM domain-containing protein n=1 Tax=Penicillium malachiteum TaxID=1324776 RepID=A0AAD6HVB4_9EURO|nr:hypothetical protein N7493_001643 [Penicillium malachiteum]
MQSAQHTSEYSPEREHRESSDSSSLHKQPVGENALYYGTETLPVYNAENPEDSERGLGSTLLGGAGGAYVGHQMGGGMATAGGAIIGALGANAVSHGFSTKDMAIHLSITLKGPLTANTPPLATSKPYPLLLPAMVEVFLVVALVLGAWQVKMLAASPTAKGDAWLGLNVRKQSSCTNGKHDFEYLPMFETPGYLPSQDYDDERVF